MEALRELDRLRGDRADRHDSIPGRLLLGSFGSAAILLSFAGVVKLLQMPIDEISLILSAGLILLILAVVYDGLKHIKGPAGMEWSSIAGSIGGGRPGWQVGGRPRPRTPAPLWGVRWAASARAATVADHGD